MLRRGYRLQISSQQKVSDPVKGHEQEAVNQRIVAFKSVAPTHANFGVFII